MGTMAFIDASGRREPWLFPIQSMWKSGYNKCAYIYFCREDELTYWTFFNGWLGHILVSQTHPYSGFLVFHAGFFLLPPIFMLSHLPKALVLQFLKVMPCQNLLIARISFGCPTIFFSSHIFKPMYLVPKYNVVDSYFRVWGCRCFYFHLFCQRLLIKCGIVLCSEP